MYYLKLKKSSRNILWYFFFHPSNLPSAPVPPPPLPSFPTPQRLENVKIGAAWSPTSKNLNFKLSLYHVTEHLPRCVLLSNVITFVPNVEQRTSFAFAHCSTTKFRASSTFGGVYTEHRELPQDLYIRQTLLARASFRVNSLPYFRYELYTIVLVKRNW